MQPLAADSKIECYILLVIEVEDEEWAKVLCFIMLKEGEVLGRLVPHD